MDRDTLHRNIQIMCAGLAVKVVMPAQIDSLAATLGFCSETIEDADKLIDVVAGDLKAAVRRGWKDITEAKAQTPAAAGRS